MHRLLHSIAFKIDQNHYSYKRISQEAKSRPYNHFCLVNILTWNPTTTHFCYFFIRFCKATPYKWDVCYVECSLNPQFFISHIDTNICWCKQKGSCTFYVVSNLSRYLFLVLLRWCRNIVWHHLVTWHIWRVELTHWSSKTHKITTSSTNYLWAFVKIFNEWGSENN